jgi:hypothetical protein
MKISGKPLSEGKPKKHQEARQERPRTPRQERPDIGERARKAKKINPVLNRG